MAPSAQEASFPDLVEWGLFDDTIVYRVHTTPGNDWKTFRVTDELEGTYTPPLALFTGATGATSVLPVGPSRCLLTPTHPCSLPLFSRPFLTSNPPQVPGHGRHRHRRHRPVQVHPHCCGHGEPHTPPPFPSSCVGDIVCIRVFFHDAGAGTATPATSSPHLGPFVHASSTTTTTRALRPVPRSRL